MFEGSNPSFPIGKLNDISAIRMHKYLQIQSDVQREHLEVVAQWKVSVLEDNCAFV